MNLEPLKPFIEVADQWTAAERDPPRALSFLRDCLGGVGQLVGAATLIAMALGAGILGLDSEVRSLFETPAVTTNPALRPEEPAGQRPVEQPDAQQPVEQKVAPPKMPRPSKARSLKN